MSTIIIKKTGIVDNDENFCTYEFENINYSFINAIRRTILSDIPVYGFNGFPNLLRRKNKNKKKKVIENIKIKKNTTRLNNEIIKQRLTCIPIYLPVSNEINHKELVFKLDTNEIAFDDDVIPRVKYITTEHFKIFENIPNEGKEEEKEHDDSLHYINSKNEKKNEGKFYPLKPFKDENGKEHYLLITRLNPEISNQIPKEELILTCKLSIHTAKENGCFNAVSCCSYSYYPDNEKQIQEWNAFKNIQEQKNPSIKLNENDEKNWYNLNAKRHYIPNKFNFKVESLGIYNCDEIIKKAINIIVSKLNNFKLGITDSDSIRNINYKFICNKSLINVPYAYDITLTNEDYTIGKVVEYILHKNMDLYNLIYVGFIKKHPHDNDSIIRVVLNDEHMSDYKIKAQKNEIKNIFIKAYDECIKLLTNIKSNF